MTVKSRHYLLGLLALAAGVFYLGPRPPPVIPILLHPVELPSDLDAYLAAQEVRLPALRPALAAHIQWENPQTKAPTPVALVYLQSFSGSPLELNPVVENSARRLHSNVFFQRLSGHGQDTEALKSVRVSQWLEDANQAMEIGKRLGQKVVVVAFSTGATLGMWLAVHQAPMAGMVMLSPNFAPKDWRASLLLLPWGDRIAQAANHGSRYREWKPTPLQAERWTYRQPMESLIEMMSLVHYVDSLDFSLVRVPVLCFYTDSDETVSVDLIKQRFKDIGSSQKELIDIRDAKRHVLTGDAFSPQTNGEVTDRIVKFVQGIPR